MANANVPARLSLSLHRNPAARQADMDPITVETFSNPSRRSRLDAMEDL